MRYNAFYNHASWFDLRERLKKGDVISYNSMKGLNGKGLAAVSGGMVVCTARVVAVYPEFAIVQLSKCRDTANFTDIHTINGHSFSW